MLWIFDKKGLYKFQYLGYWFYIINDFLIDPKAREKAMKEAEELLDVAVTIKEATGLEEEISKRVALMMQARDIVNKKYNLGLDSLYFYELPDGDFYISGPKDKEKTELNHAKDITKEITKYFPDLEDWSKKVLSDPILFSRALILTVGMVFETLIREYLQKSAPVYSGVELYKSLQPRNVRKIRTNNIAKLTQNLSELEAYPEARKNIERFIKEKHEIFVPKIDSVYEQMVIDIISTLVYKKDIEHIRIYFKPVDIAYSEHNKILIISIKDLSKRFKLTNEEIWKIFRGRKNQRPAIERVSKKEFYITGQSGILTASNLYTYHRYDATDGNISYIQIEPHWIFYAFDPPVKDNLWKLREISKMTPPKLQRPVLALRNKFITLRKPLRASFETLAGYAGFSSRRRKEKSLMRAQVVRCLEILKNIREIDYTISKDIVIIEPLR